MDDVSEPHSNFRKLIGAGANIAGGAIGGALGFFAAGPEGAAALGAAGAAASAALQHIGEEAAQRLLGPREAARIGGVLAIAAAEISKRINAGEVPRQDDFFEEKAAGRSDAEEVAESVILKSQREPEEKKIPYMGHLLSNVAFDSSISAHMAHQLAKIAESSTYRQLCLLRLAVVKNNYRLRQSDYRGRSEFENILYQVLYECLDLYHKSLVNFGNGVVFGLTDIKPASMAIQGLGTDLYYQMNLSEIPDSDLLPIVHQLR
ncbi:MAG TPA: hypothetical protein VHC00_16770 [Rhizobiaceae bacterium]|nr:hypothetical protein [Rhizobiaceae bacterium]